jgi:hypothetical protein
MSADSRWWKRRNDGDVLKGKQDHVAMAIELKPWEKYVPCLPHVQRLIATYITHDGAPGH